ncbi:DUF6476 family protein [Profundibacter amoris]|uniref:Fimbrial protein n=1 Tax=Profundibacter amoris TaxID=2171755 RepID=A0A347UER6_9RHOB|nr:DUF6476 family protein [Profundibacter amoris]AXX97344.1 hypothetical protein BAR1_05000 [Profundibacter amoris]
MNDAPLEPEEPANLKFLRRLVTILTGTMIVGVVVIIGLLVMRINAKPAAVSTGPELPASIVLPDGARATAFTMGKGWYAVVTEGDEILIYDADSGKLRQRIRISNQP